MKSMPSKTVRPHVAAILLILSTTAGMLRGDDQEVDEGAAESAAALATLTERAEADAASVLAAALAEENTAAAAASSMPADPAERVIARLEERVAATRDRLEEITVDLSVLSEIGSLEAQLKEARLQSEREKLDEQLAALQAAKRQATLAAASLIVCADEEKVRGIFDDLRTEAARARDAVERYRDGRATKIAMVEAQAPGGRIEGQSLEDEVTALLVASLDGMEESRRSSFLTLMYGVAGELDVRIPQELDGGKVARNPYADVLSPSLEARAQMTLLTLVAYRNRMSQKTEGTILGRSLDDLVSARAVAPERGRIYRLTDRAREVYLLDLVRRIWPDPEISVGPWDLSKQGKTAEGIRKFASGEFEAPDAGLLALVEEVETVVRRHEREVAIADEVARTHTEALDEARRFDADMERVASAVFQAEALQERQADRLDRIGEAFAFFSEEADRLGDDALATPRHDEIRRHAAILRDAAISVSRAERIARDLALR